VTELVLMKTPSGALVPCDEGARAFIEKMKAGAGVRAKITKVRNLPFHRKFFALLQVGFDAWEPPEPEYKGMTAQKNFERFREDVTCLAGFYDVVTSLNGEVRVHAKSISFSNMEQDQFEKLYSAVADVLLQKVLTKYTRADLDDVVNAILGFV